MKKIELKKYKEVVMYLVFGVLTTLINIVSFFLLSDIFNIGWITSNIIAWFLSILFAYFTNKKYVFDSKNKKVIKEFLSFIIFRVISLAIDMIIMYLLIDISSIDSMISKIITNIIIVITNYIFSKFIIFKK